MKRFFFKPTAILVGFAMMLSSCASIVSKSNYPISIRTDPKGAAISITDKKGNEVYKGKSPAEVSLKSGAGFFSKAEYQVKLTSSGFDEKVIPINFKINGWYWGNLLIGGLIGMLVIDPATGAMWKVVDPVVYEKLSPSSTTTSIKEPTLKIVTINEATDEVKAKMIAIK